MLTGTPVTRWNDDIMPFLMRAAPQQIKSVCGGLSIDRFNLRFCIVQEKKFSGMRFPVKMTVGSKNEDELGEILSSVATRRTLADVWDAMPALTFTRYEVQLSNRSEIADMLKSLKKMSAEEIQKAMQSDDAALATVRRQIGMGIVKDAAAFISERIDSGLPVIVGAWHTDVIDALHAELKEYRVRVIDGRTSGARKEEITADWNDGKLDVIVGQIGAMGVSLNLQKGGNNIIVVEEDWSPSIMDQFYARLHRMGQEKAVHVDTLFADTPLNKALTTIAGRKRRSHANLGNAIEGTKA
jgi:SNF2 family DNA or RNA helicase